MERVDDDFVRSMLATIFRRIAAHVPRACRAFAYVVPLVVMAESGLSDGYDYPNAISRSSQEAQLVVRGVVSGATPFLYGADKYDIATVFSVQVNEMVKGDSVASVELTRLGGEFNGYFSRFSHQARLDVGEEYVMFLAECIGDTTFVLHSDNLLGVVDGDSVRFHGFQTESYNDWFSDVENAVATVSDVEALRQTCDAVLRGEIVSVATSSSVVDASLGIDAVSCRVDSVLSQSSGPTLSDGATFSLQILPSLGAVGVVGSKPALRVGDLYLLFVEHVGGSWQLYPSVYAAREIVGDVVLVESSPVCCYGKSAVDQSTLQSVLDSLDE